MTSGSGHGLLTSQGNAYWLTESVDQQASIHDAKTLWVLSALSVSDAAEVDLQIESIIDAENTCSIQNLYYST